MINRLQFRHHNEVFNSKEDAREYIYSQIRFAESGLSVDNRALGYSLLAEPTILLYKNEEDETNPHLMLAIGSQTNESVQYSDNRFCIIDIDATEQEIVGLEEKLDKAIKSLTLIALSSDTLNFYSDKTDDGTYVSGDVKVADAHIFDDVRYKNNLMVTPEGLFIYVNLTYDEAAETFTFTVSNADGTLSNTSVKLPNNYIVSGHYDERDESIHLQMKEGEEVIVDCEKLIDEWGVEGEASSTPVVLTKEEIDYGISGDSSHYHTEPWQDVLRADVRIKDETKVLQQDGTYKYEKDPRSTNILDRTSDGRYLYVDGKASNIIYYMNGEKSTVKAALDELQKIKLSSDSDNILINKVDGFFASSKLEYISSANKLIFKTSGHPDKEIQLNSVELFERVYYDPTREVLVLTYKDSTGQTQFVEVPIGEMIRDWEWEPLNEGHNVKIVKKRNVSGNDKVSADVKIYDDPDNILVDKNHELFVKGTADNIKYENGTVKDALDAIKDKNEEQDDKLDEVDGKIGSGFTNDPHDNVTYKFEQLSEKLNNEIERSTTKDDELETALNEEITRSTEKDTEHDEAIERIDTTIGSGFSTDAHETVTYKFEQLQNQVNEEADKIQNEIDRSTVKDYEHDGKIQAIEDEIGEGFGPRNTVRDEIDNLQDEIDALSAETANKLQDINSDNSINIDKTEPTIPVISVNLSEEVEHGKENIIKLNNDGLYAGVDLSYIEEANKLIFSTTNGEKEIQLESMSSIISITYDPSKEAIIITYMTNGHEVKTVEIPVGDLINEWRVEDGHPHAVQLEKVRIASGTSEQDVLKASVIITDDHDDNILVMDDGALYVPGAQIAQNAQDIVDLKERMDTAEGDIDALENALANEIARATSEEQRIESKLDAEIDRSTAKDVELENTLNVEITRSTEKDQELANAIAAEVTRATSAETALQTSIDNEVTRATTEEIRLQHLIEDEAQNRINSDTTLDNKIQAETARARETETRIETALNNEINRATTKENELEDAIQSATLTFEDTHSINFNNPQQENNVVKADVKIANAPDNIILIDDVKDGVYASVDLTYIPSSNTLKFKVNGEEKVFPIAAGSILDSAWYDPVTKNLVFRTKTASGEFVEITIPAYDLFNAWEVDNKPEGCALELNLVTGRTDPTSHEPLLDQLWGRVLISPLEDNQLTIDTNGLYVSGSGATIAQCVSGKTDKLYELLYGEGEAMANCGENTRYKPYVGSCVISAATSFNEADRLLNDKICQILNMWVSGITCTNESSWIEDGMNRKLQVDARLSHGKYATMTDEDLYTENIEGAYIDPTNTEFTDTNALRIVCLSEGSSGITPSVETKQNGIYLSNVWDCGLYYDASTLADQEAKGKAQAAGYNTNYSTDDDSSARNYNYMNNVRQ